MRAIRPAQISAFTLALSALLGSASARADKVALLPSRGGTDERARIALDAQLARALSAMGHLVVLETPAALKAAGVVDGVADTAEEYRDVGAHARVDWVLVGSVEPAVSTSRVELGACLIKLGRVESVAREVHQATPDPEVKEMLTVLLRPEGVGAGELPWEKAGPVAPPAPPQPQPPATVTVTQPPPPPALPVPPAPPPQATTPAPAAGKVGMEYPFGRRDVWPAYSGGNRAFIGAVLGVAGPVARPIVAGSNVTVGSGASFVGQLRGGYAIGDFGLEALADFGGNLAGPAALWLDVGARWMWNPLLKTWPDGKRSSPLFIGPEVTFGMFARLGAGEVKGVDGATYSAPTEAHPVLGAAIDVAYALSPSIQLDAQLGNLRWVPSGSGSILLMGMTAGAAYRF